jgi:hypothetical protein
MLLNFSACDSGCGTDAQEYTLHYPDIIQHCHFFGPCANLPVVPVVPVRGLAAVYNKCHKFLEASEVLEIFRIFPVLTGV